MCQELQFWSELRIVKMLPIDEEPKNTSSEECIPSYKFKVRKEAEEKSNELFEATHLNTPEKQISDFEKCIRMQCSLSKGSEIKPGMSQAEEFYEIHKAAWNHLENFVRNNKERFHTPQEAYWIHCQLMADNATKWEPVEFRNLMAHFYTQEAMQDEAHKNILTCPCNKEDGRDIYTRLCTVITMHSRRYKKPYHTLGPSYFMRYRNKYPHLSYETFMARQAAHAVEPTWKTKEDSTAPRQPIVAMGARDDQNST